VIDSPPAEDRGTDLPPLAPKEIMAYIRCLCREMEVLMPAIAKQGSSPPWDAAPSMYRLFECVDTVIEGASGSEK